ncbi:MAG: SRPBCC family protein [Actinomycetota bacterium]|nr:SRPBCC family protein [Actinomycetota bacterium]
MTVHDMHLEETTDIAAAPADVYALVSDLPRMGEWSPENRGGRWEDGCSGAVGDVFHGDNKIGDREWTVACNVTVADAGSQFEFITGAEADDGPFVRWTYRLADNGGRTTVTEIWDVEQLPPTLRALSEKQLAGRKAAVQAAMQATLAGIKATAEG